MTTPAWMRWTLILAGLYNLVWGTAAVLLPVAGLAVAAFATVFIGIMPDRFIQIVNWALGIAQAPAIAKLMH